MVGVFDPDQERARALAEQCGGAIVASRLEGLADIESEIANICSPPAAHLAQASLLAGARYVFVEKPVGVNRHELDLFSRLPRCVPIVQWRAGRAIRAVRRALGRGEFGTAPVISLDLAWGRSEDYVRARGASWGAGAVLSVGIHALDAALWALGQEIVEYKGLANSREGAWGETAAVGVVRFASGALLSLRISFDGGADLTRIVFCGNGLTAIIEGGEGDPTASNVRWLGLPGSAARLASLAALEHETSGATGSPLLVPYFADAISAIREGREPGDTERLPAICDVFAAHNAALALTSPTSPARP